MSLCTDKEDKNLNRVETKCIFGCLNLEWLGLCDKLRGGSEYSKCPKTMVLSIKNNINVHGNGNILLLGFFSFLYKKITDTHIHK